MSGTEGFSDPQPEFEDGATLYDLYRRLQATIARVEAEVDEWADVPLMTQYAVDIRNAMVRDLRAAMNGTEAKS